MMSFGPKRLCLVCRRLAASRHYAANSEKILRQRKERRGSLNEKEG